MGGAKGQGLGAESSTNLRQQGSLRPLKGRAGGGTGSPAHCQDQGWERRRGRSRALTALLPGKRQLEFPPRNPKPEAAASAQRPHGPTLLQQAEGKAGRKDGRRAPSAPAGSDSGARLRSKAAPHTQRQRSPPPPRGIDWHRERGARPGASKGRRAVSEATTVW